MERSVGERMPIGAVIGLGITQIIGYGTLYYGFSILSGQMSADFGWSREWIYGALSAAMLIGGLASPWLGRTFDRIGAGKVMAAGSVIAAAALFAGALSPAGTLFLLALIVQQVAANLVQYGAAFALLVELSPAGATRSITYLTLIAGFASTLFWPLTGALHAHMGWREVYLVFAGLNLVVCLPIHVWLSRLRAPASVKVEPPATTSSWIDDGNARGVVGFGRRRRAFALMVTGISLQYFVSSAILVHMVPMMGGLGLGSAATLAGSLFGPSQVASRLLNMMFGRNLDPLRLALASASMLAAGLLTLMLTAPSVVGALVYAVLFGMGNGILSIVSGTLPLHLFGRSGYGTMQGRIMAARLILSALAPFAFAWAMENIGTRMSLGIAALVILAGLLAFWRLRKCLEPELSAASR